MTCSHGFVGACADCDGSGQIPEREDYDALGGSATRALPTIVRADIFRADGEWCYSAWLAGNEYDHGDVLGVDPERGDAEAIAEAQRQFPGAEIRRIEQHPLRP